MMVSRLLSGEVEGQGPNQFSFGGDNEVEDPKAYDCHRDPVDVVASHPVPDEEDDENT
jgi:hypothetical protein